MSADLHRVQRSHFTEVPPHWLGESEAEGSLLAKRPYDLRHAAVSLWLNAGVPVTEVAARAGHSIAVLLKVYAKCIDGERDEMNDRIERALAA